MDFTESNQTCQLGDVAVALVVQIVDPDGAVINISAASNMKIKLRMPDGTTKNFTAVLYTNGSDGKMLYTTLAGDLGQTGTYQIQGKLSVGGGLKSSFVGTFDVLDNINAL